ncbi:cation:dicarboxylase symporter family transporter [Weissella paramesenteroides]|uniref:Proton/sodium-glutamate symport protein GltT n=2 Tax=Weissella paramesenteroides TaxID=1249 RepID=C5RAB9_WEIPA|nr:cation:dicarboxylase symporter family transporter [Weissella paramesenteroides]ATF40900.1 glutamate/aspartate:proton symporter GltP [Weissella paramesenteroides]EER74973.1 proton/sodium-glutamate symport protein GltT [Weissella paramesenteroides ATCC 33313]KAA8439109.1 cation:dicarboxylase symporter family transporter [Weissella paramesenteroides]KAA8440183.1 cation:dicarboxylase symporter family transporter [Weissella paramesenteroides]KAA8443906.1 cation:dicarboxylase symporter family tra
MSVGRKTKKEKRNIGLGWRIVFGLIIGIVLGVLFFKNKMAITAMQNIGTMFIGLIQMIVLPIVVSSLTVGIAKMGDIRKLGRVGLKTLIYFEILSTIAIVLGMIAGNVFEPGAHVNVHNLQATNISSYLSTAKSASSGGIWSTVMDVVPTNFFASLADSKMLQVIVFSVFFGLGTAAIGQKGQIIIDVLDAVAEVMFKVTNWVMQLAPIGVGALIGATVAQMGLNSLKSLGYFIFVAYLTMIIFMIVVLGGVLKIYNVNILNLFKVLRDEMILAFTTASSEATLPRIVSKMEKFGVSQGIVSFVVPTGYSFNLDGSAIYQAIGALFMAQAYNIHLSVMQQLTLLVVLMITSKGMAGVPGASFVVLLATVSSIGVPAQGLAFIAGVDRLIDMGRTVVNVVGNSTASIVISKSEKDFDEKKNITYLAKLND